MKKRHTEEQIIRILKQAETGIPVADLLREHNISQGTFYRWKAKFLKTNGAVATKLEARVAELEEELRRVERERDILPLEMSIPRFHVFTLLCG